MAIAQVKRSVRRTQPSRRVRASKSKKRFISPFRRLFQFPQAKAKLVEDVEFSTAAGYHNISINFQDKTCLNFAIETSFTVETDYSDWKTGNQRVLRAWRPIPSFKS